MDDLLDEMHDVSLKLKLIELNTIFNSKKGSKKDAVWCEIEKITEILRNRST